MMIGIYAIAGRRVDDAFLAAVLTVIGYSVMDTIVILDRIRENVKLMDGKPFDTIVNTSILQTMTRSVNTLATVVITLVALLTFGGASLAELRVRAARRHLLGRLPLDLLLGAARRGDAEARVGAHGPHEHLPRARRWPRSPRPSPPRAAAPRVRPPRSATAKRLRRHAAHAASSSARARRGAPRRRRATSARDKSRSTTRSSRTETSAPSSRASRSPSPSCRPPSTRSIRSTRRRWACTTKRRSSATKRFA